MNPRDRMPLPGESVSWREKFRFNCHVCKLEVSAGEDEHGRAMLVHVSPMCARFDELDPADFLREARETWQARQRIAKAAMRAADRLKKEGS